MINLVLAELRRLRSTRLWLLAAGLAVVFGGGITSMLALIGPHNLQPPMPGLDTPEGASTVLGLISLMLFIPAVLGTAAVTGEYRHGTITPTFLAEPRRWRVLVAKLTAFGIAGGGYGLIAATTAVIGVSLGAQLHATPLALGPSDLFGFIARIVLCSAIYTLIGVGIGALSRKQVPAVLIVLAYFYFLEPLLMIIPGFSMLYPFLPGGATSALVGFSYLTETLSGQLGVQTVALSSLAAALVLISYAGLASILALAIPLRRDVV